MPPQVRLAGDRYVFLEYGPMELHISLRVRVHEMEQHLAALGVDGLVETSPGGLGLGGRPACVPSAGSALLCIPARAGAGPLWLEWLAAHPPTLPCRSVSPPCIPAGVRSVMIEYDQRRLPLAKLLQVG